MNKILLLIIVIVLFLYLMKPEINNYIPSQEEIQSDEYIDKSMSIKDYPYPQISRSFKKLSKTNFTPFNNLNELLPSGKKELELTRNIDTPNNISTKRIYLPDYYRKDRLSGNTLDTEEYRSFVSSESENQTENSWTDENVSEHPKFYNSDIKNELTDIGSFFDKNNQYFDKTSSNTNSLVSDKCYIDKNNNKYCENNTRLQLIPPKLISNPEKCPALNINNNNKVMNGSVFYDNINPSSLNNEFFSSPLKDELGVF